MSCAPPKKILIMDDEPSVLLSLSYVLKTEGVEVLACSEPNKAVEVLEYTSFDLVLADIRMSGAEGIEGLELLSFVKKRHCADVIVMTGHGSVEIESDAYRRGALHYFTKPIDIQLLLDCVAARGIPVRRFSPK